MAEHMANNRGTDRVKPERRCGPRTPPNPNPRPRPKRPRPRNAGTQKGEVAASETKPEESGLPEFRWGTVGQELSEEDSRFGAVWEDETPAHPRGRVTANRDFSPVVLLVADMKKLWASAYGERVERAVLAEIKVSMIAKLAEFRSNMVQLGWKAPEVRDILANPGALTLCMVGFASEYDAIRRQLTETLCKPRKLKAVG